MQPLEPKVREVAENFEPGRADFLTALAAFLSKRYGVEVQAADWPPDSLPAHLRPRVEVVDRENKPLAAGRDLPAIQATLEKADLRSDAWEHAARRWEKPAVKTWSFGDLPDSVVIEEMGGVPLLAFPGLAVRADEVDVRLFRKREEAETASRAGVRRLAERAYWNATSHGSARNSAACWPKPGRAPRPAATKRRIFAPRSTPGRSRPSPPPVGKAAPAPVHRWKHSRKPLIGMSSARR